MGVHLIYQIVLGLYPDFSLTLVYTTWSLLLKSLPNPNPNPIFLSLSYKGGQK